MTNLIMPHGSHELNTLYIEDEMARSSMYSAAAEMRTLEITSAAAANAVMMGAGYFNPLTGYMNKEEALKVSTEMLTLDDVFWPVPIVNITSDANSLDYTHGEEIALKDPNVDGNPVIAIQRIDNVEKLSDDDIDNIVRNIFGTIDDNHPGVKNFKDQGKYIISGSIEVLNYSYFPSDFPETFATAPGIREMLTKAGWSKTVAYQTRNPMHRAHEELCKMAYERLDADGVLIHMLLGKLKEGDIPGDVRDAARLELAMRGVDYVIHAAALKHVQTAEYNPFEAAKTNINGAENVVTAAIRAGVKKVIALSTDKACNPINLYGATKLAADKIFIAGNNLSGAGGCSFSVVRYGNVIGSRGSVVPLFQKLIKEKATELPITDFRMTRFWITLDQGINFVLSCLKIMQGGEIFIPKIPSMKITDLAHSMAPDLLHREIGIRAGEKLHELMISEDDARNSFEFTDRYAILTPFLNPEKSIYERRGGELVGSGFSYASETNAEWLTPEDFKKLI